jgi:hypothetical protein
MWQQAGQDNLTDDGYFRFYLDVELINVPAALARSLLERAADPIKPHRWHFAMPNLPFRLGVVNSFEEALDVWQPTDCPMIPVDPQQTPGVSWADGVAHSGRRSLLLTGAGASEWVRAVTNGPVCRVQPHTRHRFSAWVKTAGVARFARLELCSFEYSQQNLIDAAESAKVAGDSEWTQISVELDAGDEAYVQPRFALYGTGQAWFDDARLEPIG